MKYDYRMYKSKGAAMKHLEAAIATLQHPGQWRPEIIKTNSQYRGWINHATLGGVFLSIFQDGTWTLSYCGTESDNHHQPQACIDEAIADMAIRARGALDVLCMLTGGKL